jgi:hypothetical protein
LKIKLYKRDGKIIGYKGSQDSSVRIVSRLWGWKTGSRSREGERYFFSVAARKILGSTQPPIQCVKGVLFPEGKAVVGVKLTTHLHLMPRSRMMELYLHSARVLNYIIKYRDNFTFPFNFFLIWWGGT